MNYGIVVFPGSNCDHDALTATSVNAHASSRFLWHKETVIPSDIDCVILPGGFSYGDYLRSGAIARFSPIMKAVTSFAADGGFVLGICNGFQVLTEAGLLPGALARNDRQLFSCTSVTMAVENNETAFTSAYGRRELVSMPIAHGEGSFFADDRTIDELESNRRVVFRYCNADGVADRQSNPNGSVNNIAGIIS
ncbi:MAG: phosphoribosylformylglycinamidine synthase subunit PurQ, partial [Candidatus Kapaibacterium sp.]